MWPFVSTTNRISLSVQYLRNEKKKVKLLKEKKTKPDDFRGVYYRFQVIHQRLVQCEDDKFLSRSLRVPDTESIPLWHTVGLSVILHRLARLSTGLPGIQNWLHPPAHSRQGYTWNVLSARLSICDKNLCSDITYLNLNLAIYEETCAEHLRRGRSVHPHSSLIT